MLRICPDQSQRRVFLRIGKFGRIDAGLEESDDIVYSSKKSMEYLTVK